MKIKSLRNAILAAPIVIGLVTTATSQRSRQASASAIPNSVLLKIIRYEDQRNWCDDLKSLMIDSDAHVRKRAALAAGRIGDERAVPALADMLLTDRDTDVRQMAAFALGEIESPGGAYALTEVLKRIGSDLADGIVRARAVEALGKIVGAMIAATPTGADATKAPDDRLDIIRAAIVDALRFEDSRRSNSDRLTILLGLTAVLRAKPDGVGPLIIKFLDYSDPRIVADALNTMARLRLKDGNERVRQLLNHSDPIVRANAARVIGAAEHKEAFDALLDRALHDQDLRVRVSAIRALGSLKDARAAEPLLRRAESLLLAYRGRRGANPSAKNELLEIATALGRALQNSNNTRAIDFLKRFRILDQLQSAETEIAFARISPETYLNTEPLNGTPKQIRKVFPRVPQPWRASSSLTQGLAEFANLPDSKKQLREAAMANFGIEVLSQESHEPQIVPAIPTELTAYAAFKKDVNAPGLFPDTELRDRLSDTLRGYVTYKPKGPPEPFRIVPPDNRTLGYNDVFVRTRAAELLGDEPPSKENTDALITALSQALKFDAHDNDAALAILDALAKQKNKEANEAIKSALNSEDHLIRRRAVALLKANGLGDFSDRIGLVKTRYTDVDYRRAIARIGRKVTATVVTSKGAFTIELLADDAPLTVDNFVQLAKKGFFNGQTIPRVVPNFVIQAGDPRGDQNGGPGYQIRCEINEVPYDRAAVGMALSGKDTGGSQWFVTHSPQPHLDGGYTVFGRVIRGMDVVDNVARGDVIRRVIVSER